MTMFITTILFYFLARYGWKWSNFVALPLCGSLALVELCYFGLLPGSEPGAGTRNLPDTGAGEGW